MQLLWAEIGHLVYTSGALKGRFSTIMEYLGQTKCKQRGLGCPNRRSTSSFFFSLWRRQMYAPHKHNVLFFTFMKGSYETSSSQIKSKCFVYLLLYLSSPKALWETSSWSYILFLFDKDKLYSVGEKGKPFLDYSLNKKSGKCDFFFSPALKKLVPLQMTPHFLCFPPQHTKTVWSLREACYILGPVEVIREYRDRIFSLT